MRPPAPATRLTIIADDLTGAADAAAALVPHGECSVLLTFDSQRLPSAITAINTVSRDVAAHVAYERVAKASHLALGAGSTLYKKVDSLLRGNVGTELDAVLATARRHDGLGRARLVVAPAFPAMGRTTVGGRVEVRGRPRPDIPYGGDVGAALQIAGLAVAVVGRPGGETRLRQALESFATTSVDAIVVDATSDDDLRLIARASECLSYPAILAGSGGLSRHLAQHGPAPTHQAFASAAGGRPLPGPVLFVCGSHSLEALAQAKRLVEAGLHEIAVGVAPAGPHADPTPPSRNRAGAPAAIGAFVKDTLLRVDPRLEVHARHRAGVERALTDAAAGLAPLYRTLVLTGGSTAQSLLVRLGVSAMRVEEEVLPGVVRSRADVVGLPVVITKAGAFGDDDTLLDLARLSTGAEPSAPPSRRKDTP
ncbi:MAG TPA: four-carbon acid sugar kinase family protein [Microbacteriaceae bacterium]|nr:four-carbon acid sugar kinase family protein [Microbacteriaceae bacterium]